MVSALLTNDMVDFLGKVKTPVKTHVGNDTFVATPEEMRYVTQVKGATLPMRIRMVYQPPDDDEVSAPKPSEIVQFQLLVNPSNMNHGKTNTVQPVYTRTGFVTQMWGPNQDSISITGKSAGFMVQAQGLATFGARWSLGFHNIMALLTAYRNNGYQLMDPIRAYNDDKHLNRVIEVVRGVELSYDGDSFQGHFNSFTYDEDAANPYIVNVNFEFVVSALTGFDSDTSQIRGHFIPAYYTQWSRGRLTAKQESLQQSTAYQQSKQLVEDAVVQGASDYVAQKQIADAQAKKQAAAVKPTTKATSSSAGTVPAANTGK